jgi:hypothetical protein
LRNDGTLVRWTNGWKTVSSYPGLAAVKTMTLISQTASYDTFLANTSGGALYTIHVPLIGAAVVTKIRTSGWQTFDTLVAEKCGKQGTLLTAIDTQTGTAHLYAVGHANGTATAINSLGKITGRFADPVQFRYNLAGFVLTGE